MSVCTNSTPCGHAGDGNYHSPVCTQASLQRLAGRNQRASGVLAESAAPSRDPERADRPGDQPLPTPGSQSVFAEVRRRLDEREATGVRRYGRSLETFNGRDAALDLEEELFDGLAYVTQLRLEHAAVVDALVTLARWIDDTADVVPSGGGVEAAMALAAKLDRRPR